MTFQVKIASAAIADIQTAIEWYNHEKDDLGAEFLDELYATIDSVATDPLLYQIRYKHIRIKFMKRFPYGIHFRLREHTMLIVAVFHTSMSPNRWEERSK